MRPHTKSEARDKNALFGLFTNRKISTKIAAGFATVLAIMLVISGTAYLEFGTVADSFFGFSHVVQNTNVVTEIDRQFLAFRSYAEDTSRDLNEDIANAKKAQAAAREQIDKALATIKSPERLKAIKDINELFGTYSKDFERVAPMRVEQQAFAKDTLNPGGQKLLADLQQLHIDGAELARKSGEVTNGGSMILFGETISMAMQLRLDVEKLTVKHDVALINSAKQNFKNIGLIFGQLEKTPSVAPLLKNIKLAEASVKAYDDAFVKFADRSALIEQLLHKDMNAIASKIDTDVAAIKENSQKIEDQTQRQLGDRIAWFDSIILALAVGGLGLGVAFAWVIGRIISKPVVALVPELRKLADGDFNVSLTGLGRKDEIGEISAALEMVVEKMGGIINNIKVAAVEVTSASAEISTSTTDLSQRTEEQAASLEQTSASMEEMSATVRKNAENARQANDFAIETNTVAERGGAVVGDAVSAMARIEESSHKIADIIGVIDEIARQTNLLALNAAVEAARAGEAGRGFAVVASEVRSLAQRSSQAAKDIKDLITHSSSEVKEGVDLVNRAGESLNEIVASIKKVTSIVADIANASMEQSTGIEQINKALTQMDEATQQNSALVEQNAATAKTLENQAKSMDERVAVFRLRAGGHVEEIVASARRATAGEPRPVRQALRPSRGPAAVSRRPVASTRAPAAPAHAAAPAEVKPQPVAAPKHAAAASAAGGPVGRMHKALAAAVNDDQDWKEF